MQERLLSAAAIACLSATICGCGASAPATRTDVLAHFSDLGHRHEAPRLPAHLGRGTVVALSVTNQGYVRPTSLRLASDATFSSARWSSWGTARTTGHGTATVQICTSSCGAGHPARYRARVVFSGIRTCGATRYYEHAQITLSTVKGPRPWGAFLQVPCS
jgi:hypothetical protein